MLRVDGSRGRVDELLPDVVLPTLDGRPFALHSLRGRRFLLFFWGSW